MSGVRPRFGFSTVLKTPSAILRWTSRVDLRMSSAVSWTVSGLSASNGAEDVRTAGKACSSHEEWHLHISRGPADLLPAQAHDVGPTIIST